MRRRTIFGPDMGNSDWTPIDGDDRDTPQNRASPGTPLPPERPDFLGTTPSEIERNFLIARQRDQLASSSEAYPFSLDVSDRAGIVRADRFDKAHDDKSISPGGNADFAHAGPKALLFDPARLGGETSFTPIDEDVRSEAESGTVEADTPIRGNPQNNENPGYSLPEKPPANVDWSAIPMSRKSKTDPYADFKWKAPGIIENLKRDFDLTNEQALGIVGNLGHESLGFQALQEKDPTVPGSRGGWGWAQWTGPRRRAFEAYAAQNNLAPSSDAANYGYLKHELETTHKAAINNIKKTQTLTDSVTSFENDFESAAKNKKHMDSRNVYAAKALTAYKEQRDLALAMQNTDWAKKSLRQPTIPGVQVQPRVSGYGFEVVPPRSK